jgi:energy-coupling factor transport system ATP-binding protein
MAARVLIDRFSFRYASDLPDALSELSLDIPPGSCCALIGPTGAGKSTLLHALVGILGRHHPASTHGGSIHIGEQVFTPLPRDVLFPQVGLVLQDPYIQLSGVRDTVLGELLFTLENLGTVDHSAELRIARLLAELGIEHLAPRHPSTLSGGETQRVALATMLIAAPEVLLLDEPTSALDTAAIQRLRQIIKSLQGRTTVIFTDTDVEFALSVADQVVVLHGGGLLFSGKPRDLILRLDEFEDMLPVLGWKEILDHLTGSSATQAAAAERLGKALAEL